MADNNGGGVYTQLPDGTDVELTDKVNPAEGLFNFELVQPMTQKRADQCSGLVDELEAQSFTKMTLKWPNTEVDLSKLMVAGHSFGGTTAFLCAYQDKRIKGILGNDPYMLLVSENQDVKNSFYMGKTPVFVLETDKFKDLMDIDPEHKREEFI